MGFKRQDFEFSFEFFPPKNEAGERRLRETAESLKELGPEYCSVTFGAGGSTRERTFETVTYLQNEVGLEATPHLSCIGSRQEDIRAILERYRAAGIKRIIALRGDIPEDEEAFKEGGFRYANELVAFIREFGGFEIVVGAYPEFHPEAPDPWTDMHNFVRKAQTGADIATTQYFFNNISYYMFVDEVRRLGTDIPVKVGLMPITNFQQIDRFSQICGADIPLWIRKCMEYYQEDPESQKELGIEIATRQAEDLLNNGVPGIHFYTLNKAEATRRIWENLGLGKAGGDH